jgi:hypothetical protein
MNNAVMLEKEGQRLIGLSRFPWKQLEADRLKLATARLGHSDHVSGEWVDLQPDSEMNLRLQWVASAVVTAVTQTLFNFILVL